MINKIDFKAKNLTSNASLFLLLQYTKDEGIFDMIEENLLFDNTNTNKIKMNHIKTMICGHFIGIDKLERLKLLQNDPLINEFDISVREPETVSRFLCNFSFKTTQMFRDISFKVFRKLLDKSELKSIYRQQIKTFRLKYVFIVAKIIRTARYVIMKMSSNYPYKRVYERRLS